jgi:hypothetical protein
MKESMTGSQKAAKPAPSTSRWSFSGVLLAGYLLIFNLWPELPRGWIYATGWVGTVVLSVLFLRAVRSGYFLNFWDAFWHSTVILDVFLEATLIANHGRLGFYLCAAAFVIVIGGYRWWLWRTVDARIAATLASRGTSAVEFPERHGRSVNETGGIAAPVLSSASMSETTWRTEFQAVYERGVAAWKAGRRAAGSMFSPADVAWLSGIGCSAQEAFDFVDDFLRYGEPDFATALEVAAIRRDYFLKDLGGKPATQRFSMADLPAKAAAVDGIAWLPRIIVKARLKLRGEMPDDLMYGCGGDRQFLAGIHMTLPEFLTLVRDSGTDDRRIIDAVKRAK